MYMSAGILLNQHQVKLTFKILKDTFPFWRRPTWRNQKREWIGIQSNARQLNGNLSALLYLFFTERKYQSHISPIAYSQILSNMHPMHRHNRKKIILWNMKWTTIVLFKIVTFYKLISNNLCLSILCNHILIHRPLIKFTTRHKNWFASCHSYSQVHRLFSIIWDINVISHLPRGRGKVQKSRLFRFYICTST